MGIIYKMIGHPNYLWHEFTYNNTENSTTKMTPFYANQGYHPIFDPTIDRESKVPSVANRINDLKKSSLQISRLTYTKPRMITKGMLTRQGYLPLTYNLEIWSS